MSRLTFKKWFEHFKPDEETTTILINNYTQIVEPIYEADQTRIYPQTMNYYLVGAAVDKLAEYEDAEENGLLLRLPCKAKEIVYITNHSFCRRKGKPFKCEVDEFVIENNGCYAVLNGCENFYAMRRFKAVNVSEFGRTVFLTEKEAQTMLDFILAQEGEA